MLSKSYNVGIFPVRNPFDCFVTFGVNCRPARTEVVTGDPLLELIIPFKRQKPSIDMHSDTAIKAILSSDKNKQRANWKGWFI